MLVACTASALVIRQIVVTPKVDELVLRTDPTRVKAQRVPERLQQHGHGQRLEDVEKLGHLAQCNRVDAVIHNSLGRKSRQSG